LALASVRSLEMIPLIWLNSSSYMTMSGAAIR
jgi:hypothetical protein